MNVHLGFEVGTGTAVEVPVNHLAVTGQTQMSGKTTTLEALIARSKLRALAFITKRGEGAFDQERHVPPYFRERADWQFVAAVLEAQMREKMKWERAWIMRASKGARSLADVQRNVKAAMEKAKGMSADMYLMLDEYLSIVVPQIGRIQFAPEVSLQPGVNVMDLTRMSTEMQALVIASSIEWIIEHERDTVTIIPEAWEFIPQQRGSPVLLAAEKLIRQGAGLRNYVWLDSQDIASIHKNVLRSVIVWILGVQREANEVKRTLEHIPASVGKPKVADVMELDRGQFLACWGRHVRRVYVQPAWMTTDEAEAIATSGSSVEAAAAVIARHVEQPGRDGEAEVDAKERKSYEDKISDLRVEVEKWKNDCERETTRADQEARAAKAFQDAQVAINALRRILGTPAPVATSNGHVDVEAIVQEVVRRIPVGAGGAVYQVAPIEKLRKDYQQREVAQLLDTIQSLPILEKNILALVETTDGRTGMQRLAERLGRSFGGNARVTFVNAARHLGGLGLLDIEDRQGVAKRARTKIAEDLAFYNASDADVEAVYQQVMARIAGAKDTVPA